VTDGGLHYDRYHIKGRDEWLMRIGDQRAAPILFFPPLFEEMNRTRALIAAAMRRLAEAGFCGWLPDLPGTGESERALGEVGWADWRAAATEASGRVAELSGQLPAVAAIRGGCLIDDAADAACRWRMAPVEGASLARDLARIGLAGGAPDGGYPLFAQLRFDLEHAVPASVAPVRTARLSSDPGVADVKLPGPALWRRSEPGNSADLADAIAADLSAWSRACAG
jgi:hypothetical protein